MYEVNFTDSFSSNSKDRRGSYAIGINLVAGDHKRIIFDIYTTHSSSF